VRSAPKVLFIGLDACDFDVMRRFAAAGKAPAIAALLAGGTHAITEPPIGLFEGALWPTLFTARSMPRHGFYCHEELEVGTYRHRATSPREVSGPPFWEVASDAGKRVAVIDVPHSTAARPVDGIHIAEYGCHDRHLGFHTWPPTLADDVERRFGLHPVGGIDAYRARDFAPCDLAHRAGAPSRTHAEARALFDDLVTGVDRKTELSLHYLDEGNWDVFMTVFGEAHCAGHQFWFLHDRADASHDPELLAELGDPVEIIYSRLDRAVGAHLERAGPDTAVFVLLSHGMGPMNSGVFLIDGILRRLTEAEMSVPSNGRPMRATAAAWQRLPVTIRRRLAPVVARSVRRRIRNSPDGLSTYHQVFERCPGCSAPLMAGEDGQPWFVVPNNTVYGGIRINLIGREPNGVIERGAELERVCARLAHDLLEIVKVETGEPLVRKVVRTADHYDRVEPDSLPDLLIEWERRSPTKTVYSPKAGVVHEPYEHWRTGDHFPQGMLLARGPGIPAGAALPSIPIVDLAPTMCEWLGVDLDDIDGRPVRQLAGPATVT
jgi:predicted AlkP superfamily phosphohydrolase/phosphomutase